MTLYRKKEVELIEARPWQEGDNLDGVTIGQVDLEAGSPKIGDYIVNSPKQASDRWLVSAKYFDATYEPYDPALTEGQRDQVREDQVSLADKAKDSDTGNKPPQESGANKNLSGGTATPRPTTETNKFAPNPGGQQTGGAVQGAKDSNQVKKDG